MSTSKLFRTGLSLTLIFQVLLSALVPGGMAAAASELNPPVSDRPIAPLNLTPFDPELQLDNFPANSDAESIVAATLDTTLEVSILSSPWATVDSNPSGIDDPQVFVVQAAVTNSGAETAVDVSLTLDYQDDPVNHWTLLPGESAVRTIEQLEVGETYYGYWMASYPNLSDRSHQYTITADAENAGEVSTSENYYMPEPDKTVTTRSTISTGNQGITQVDAETVVGVLFEIIIDYDLGTNPQDVTFSPVGNPDFDASALRLMATHVRFYDTDPTTPDISVDDRLFFETLDPTFNQAEVTYSLLPQKPTSTRLCSYAAIGYGSTAKYDKNYCDERQLGSIIPITGTLSIDMQKQASAVEIQQGQVVTYTIDYTNTGTFPLTYAWIWDEVDPSFASVQLDSISPTPTISESNLVAWYLGDIPISSTGTFTFSVEVDGDGQPLADNSLLVNNAFYGVNQGSLPPERALTSTFTTTVQAPAIAISKTDGLDTAEPGDLITYTLNITNTGSITATSLTITDVLPAEVSYLGSATPNPDSPTGEPLVWSNLAPLVPAGGTASITLPAILGGQVENGTVLTNTMLVQYQNTAGYLYQPPPTFDTTLVNAPDLTISKSDYPDPVLTGNTLTYTLSYSNEGPGLATNVLITDTTPVSTTFQSCTGCTIDNGLINWNIGELPGYTSGVVTFTVRVDESLETGAIIRNTDYGITSDQTGFVSGPSVTTTVSRDAAIVEGYTFMDANGDGIFTMGTEAVIPDLTLTMTNATMPVTTSDENGYYRFRVEIQGSGLVSSELPIDTFRTTPGAVYIDAVFGITETVNFGYAPIDSDFGVVYGTVYQDDNHNGDQDLGEDGLSGVELTCDQAATQSVATNALGQYTLRFDAPTTATITETNLANYVSTTPDVVQSEVIIGSSNDSPIDFGDFLGIKIVGQVFDDLNVNGVKDVGETGLSGAYLSANTDSFTTGTSGEYTLYESLSGTNPLLITETDPVGYLSTNAVPGAEMSKVDANTLRIDLPVSGNIYSGADFGDVMASSVITVSGFVWDDNGAGGGLLANGLWELGEPGLAGAVVSLSSGLNQTTGIDGAFLLYAPPDQVITVTESNPYGYISTNAIAGNDASKLDHDTLLVGPMSGGATSLGNLFGDFQQCTCGPDSFEEDDTWQQAKPIQVGASYSQTHDFCDDAIDWLSFNAQAGQVYTITTTAWGQRADTNLTLYDSDGETILAANDDFEDQTDFSSRIVWQTPADGVYYIRVDNRAALNCCDTEYDIWIETPQVTSYPIYLPLAIFHWVTPQAYEPDLNFPAGVISHICPDAYEVDDSWQLAKTIQPGVLQTHSFDSNPALFAADKDLVVFNVEQGEMVLFSIEALTNTQTLLELYDAQGLALDVTGTTELNWAPVTPGQYYLSISPMSQTTYGCSDVAGYDLLMEIQRVQYGIMLPLVVK